MDCVGGQGGDRLSESGSVCLIHVLLARISVITE